MNLTEKKISDILKNLKENYNICALKAEFASEASEIEEVMRLKELANNFDLDLAIKIGGCEAVRDINNAKKIGAKIIVAPMIESEYAAKKFLKSAQIVYSKEEKNTIDLFINIETICGYNHLENILKQDFARQLAGIVIGRTDLAHSLGFNCSDVNNKEIFDYVEKISQIAYKYNKNIVIGGGISAISAPFLKRLKERLTRIETRKIIFNADILNSPNFEDGILKAIDFEILWIQNKENYENLSIQDYNRINILKSRRNSV